MPIEITVNGESRALEEGASIGALLAALSLADTPVGVEHNGEFVEKDAHATTQLATGDSVEVVRFLGGG